MSTKMSPVTLWVSNTVFTLPLFFSDMFCPNLKPIFTVLVSSTQKASVVHFCA